MKLVKTFEYLTLLCLVMLMSLSVYGFAKGETTTITVPPTNSCLVAPKITQPAVNGNIPVVTNFAVVVYAPCSIGASYQITNLTGPQPSLRQASMNTAVDTITFPAIPITQLYNGRYSLVVTVFYPSGLGNRVIGGTAEPKMFDVKNGIPTTTTTVPTGTATVPPPTQQTAPTEGTTTSTSTTGTTGSTNTTVISPTTATLMVNGKPLTGTELQNYIATQIEAAQTVNLAPELKAAPVSVSLIAEKSEVVEMNQDKTKGRVRLSGKAEPNSTVYLYIYSEPVVVSVKTDANGNWNYTLSKELEAGKHEVYVAVKNTDGTIKAKSLPFSFFIGEATAAAPGQTAQNSSASTNYALYYLIFGLSLVAIIVSGIFYFAAKSHVKKHVETTEA